MSLVSPSLLPYGITDSTDTLLFSSGMDRRVVLWTIPNTTTTALNGLTPTDSRTRSASINLPTDLDGRVLLNAHESRFDSCNSSASRSYSDDVPTSSDSPITAVVVSHVSTSPFSAGHTFYVAAATAGKYSTLHFTTLQYKHLNRCSIK